MLKKFPYRLTGNGLNLDIELGEVTISMRLGKESDVSSKLNIEFV